MFDRNENRNNEKKRRGKEGQSSRKSGRSCLSCENWRDLKAWPGVFEGPSVLLDLLVNVAELLLSALSALLPEPLFTLLIEQRGKGESGRSSQGH